MHKSFNSTFIFIFLIFTPIAAKVSHTQNVLESGFATVTSGGHWFHATRDTVKSVVPGLLQRYDYKELILSAVAWIDSTDSLSLILFFILVFLIPVWPEIGRAHV